MRSVPTYVAVGAFFGLAALWCVARAGAYLAEAVEASSEFAHEQTLQAVTLWSLFGLVMSAAPAGAGYALGRDGGRFRPLLFVPMVLALLGTVLGMFWPDFRST